MLKYQCPNCGTPLGYQGLCWRCGAERKKEEALGWTDEQVEERVRCLIERIDALGAWEDKEFDLFWSLLAYRDICPPELQRAALAARVYRLSQLYYRAPADVRDGLIAALLQAEEADEAACLMSCLAMQGDGKALETLLELERHPRNWRKDLYVNPSVYAQGGGWSFDADGRRVQLNYETCYAMEKGDRQKDGAAVIGRVREDTCPHCGCRMTDMLVLDGKDPRLAFLGIDGIVTATCCPNCVCYTEASYSRFTLDGGSEPLPGELMIDDVEDYMGADGLRELSGNSFVLGKKPVPLFYGVKEDSFNTVGGFANWVQDWQYTACPECGKTMRYLAQIQWDTVQENCEGTLYIEICPDCHVASMHHQQT